MNLALTNRAESSGAAVSSVADACILNLCIARTMCTAGTSSFEQVQVFELCPSERLNQGLVLLDLNEARTARSLRYAIVRRRSAGVQFLTPILAVIGNILTRPFSVHPGGSFITPYFPDERVVKSIGKFHV